MSAVAIVAAYLIGAVPIGYLVGRAFGVADIRRHGSGNIGATNVLRTAGRLPALLTLAGDIAKGFAAVTLAGALVNSPAGPDLGATAACAVAAVIGNCWSIFLGFRGGKGVATGLGALLRLVPWAVLPAAAVWLGVTLSFPRSPVDVMADVVIRRAPLLGEHTDEVLAELGVWGRSTKAAPRAAKGHHGAPPYRAGPH